MTPASRATVRRAGDRATATVAENLGYNDRAIHLAPQSAPRLSSSSSRDATLMTWQGIQGHDDVVAMFRRALSRGRLAGAFLFVGPEGVGKRAFALKLAQTLLCQRSPEAEMAPCGKCPGCLQTLALTHPDLQLVSKPPDKNVLPVELFIGRKERRMQEGLCHDISLKPFMGRRKVALIDDADFLAAEGANSLLKTLEEPPPASTLILIGTSPEKQLPTIRSRCQLVRFQPLSEEVVAELALSQGIAENIEQSRQVAQHAEGSLRRAAELADPALFGFRDKLVEQLARSPLESVKLSAAVTSFVDEAGKEAPPRAPGAAGDRFRHRVLPTAAAIAQRRRVGRLARPAAVHPPPARIVDWRRGNRQRMCRTLSRRPGPHRTQCLPG